MGKERIKRVMLAIRAAGANVPAKAKARRQRCEVEQKVILI